MNDSPTSRGPGAAPVRALEICADDSDHPLTELCILAPPSGAGHYKSRIFYVGWEGCSTPNHVIKVDVSEEYDPKHELEALELAASVLGSPVGAPDLRLGVVQPIGFGTDPGFLVTRFQPGGLAQTAIDASVLGWRRPRPLDDARSHARSIARWLATFRSRAPSADGGFEPADYIEKIRYMAGQIRSRLGAAAEMDSLVLNAERYAGQMSDDDRTRMLRTHPNRGDARPKNFLVAPDGMVCAFDMEGFGYGPLEHDLSCMHHSLEYDGVRSPAAATRASMLWTEFWDEYMARGNAPTLALLGYLHFLLNRIMTLQHQVLSKGWRRRLRDEIWIRNRLRWLGGLSGDLSLDTARMRSEV